jgi:hypothetical protein
MISIYILPEIIRVFRPLFPEGANIPIAEMAPPRPRTGFVALFAVVTITGATIFFVHRQQTQERQVTLPRVFALSLVYSQLCVCAHTDDAPSRAA